MKKALYFLCILLCFFLNTPSAAAAETAEEISGQQLVTKQQGVASVSRLFDGRFMEFVQIRDGGSITLSHAGGIGSLYLRFDLEYEAVTVINEDTGERRTMADNGWLHEFLDLRETFGQAPESVTLLFDRGEARLCEINAFGEGAVPDWVQRWENCPEGQADLVLFSSHGDDEQLFFAGMLPYYAREKGYEVQVVYMTGHRNMSMRRSHEMLDGLWAVGVRNYPVFGPFGDYNTRSLSEAYQKYRDKGISREDILEFVVENVRRFRPKVAVGHDLLGEYGHGMHMIYAELLCQAAQTAMDPEVFPASAEKYGVWDIPKTYLHLYGENQIRLDWDSPLDSFGGMTAYEVTRDLGFPCHVSQQSYYSYYFAGKDRASDITENSPCEFGLYRSTVGPDAAKNDLFENLTTHAEDARRLEEQRQEETTVPTEPPETVLCETDFIEQPETAEKEDFAFVGNLPVIGLLFLLILLIIVLKKKK